MERALAVKDRARRLLTASRARGRAYSPERVEPAMGRGQKRSRRSLVSRARAAGCSRVQSASAVAGRGSTNRQPPFLVANAAEPEPSLPPVQDAKEAVTSKLLAANAVAQDGIASDVILALSNRSRFQMATQVRGRRNGQTVWKA